MGTVCRRWAGGLTVLTSLIALTGTASAAPPSLPTINEPATEGALVHPADVHMVASGFSDPDAGDTHFCSDWEIVEAASSQVVWQAPCAQGVSKVHIHLGDGTFVVEPYATIQTLLYDTDYRVRVRFEDNNGESGPWAERAFRTYPQPPPGGEVPWTLLQPGYRLEEVTDELQLPVNVAFLPDPGPEPSDPLLYVTELYGTIKVISRDGAGQRLRERAAQLRPDGTVPRLRGAGADRDRRRPHHRRRLRQHGLRGPPPPTAALREGGALPQRRRWADGRRRRTTILTMAGDDPGPLAPDLQRHRRPRSGSSTSTSATASTDATSENLDSFRGKVLRMNLDGSAPADNPFYDASDGITAADYIFAYGFRNPFGGAWRAADGTPTTRSRTAPRWTASRRCLAASTYGFDDTDGSMSHGRALQLEPGPRPGQHRFRPAADL